MNKTFQILSAIIVLSLFACKPEPIDLLVTQRAPSYAICSQYANNGIMGIALSKTFGALQSNNSSLDSTGFHLDSNLLVSHATVSIIGENLNIELKEVDKGIYVTESAALEDLKNYQVQVSIDNKLILQAQSNKQKMVAFDSVCAFRNNGEKELKIYYAIQDQLPEDNYYVINYFIKNNKDNAGTEPTPELIAKRMLEQNISIDLLSDRDFKNQRYQIEKTVSSNYSSDTLVLSLANISKGYYDFLVAQKRAGTLFNQLRGEVINFPTNVQNGYGYFQLSEPDLKVFDVVCR